MKYIIANLIPATNSELEKNVYSPITKGEFLCWLGLWLNISLHHVYSYQDFFSVSDRNFSWKNPTYLGKFMTGKHFERINSHLALTTKELPKEYAFNTKTKGVFTMGWLIVVHESMVVFLNTYAPGWTVVKRKPHPMGN